ncbi:MAG: hypothetical protein ACR65U_05740 [Methylocystis sp.]
MGYGAFMKVTNNNVERSLRTFIIDINCMYERGVRGSVLDSFNNLVIGPLSTYPETSGAYIEADNSGACSSQSARFTLKVTDESNGNIIGNIAFKDTTKKWKVESNENDDLLNVNIDNSGKQARITITIGVF